MAKYTPDQYRYTVSWSEENQDYLARVAEFPSLSAFGNSLEHALREIKQVVSLVLADLQESDEPIPEPLSLREYSGKIVLRMGEDLHRQLALEAVQQGLSLNTLICNRLSQMRELVAVTLPDVAKKSRAKSRTASAKR
ncbi:MAG: type II toxin-antitoxin system HicB family antitoxin [Acidobacteriota bacterium]